MPPLGSLTAEPDLLPIRTQDIPIRRINGISKRCFGNAGIDKSRHAIGHGDMETIRKQAGQWLVAAIWNIRGLAPGNGIRSFHDQNSIGSSIPESARNGGVIIVSLKNLVLDFDDAKGTHAVDRGAVKNRIRTVKHLIMGGHRVPGSARPGRGEHRGNARQEPAVVGSVPGLVQFELVEKIVFPQKRHIWPREAAA